MFWTPTRWTSLSHLGRTRATRFSLIWLVVVPIAARALSELPPRVSLAIAGSSVDLVLSLPFSWKVGYFGAMCFALAGTAYSLRCPRIIRLYSGYDDFERESGSVLTLRDAYERALRRIRAARAVADIRQFSTDFEDTGCGDTKQTPGDGASSAPIDRRPRDAFQLLRSVEDRSFPVLRLIVLTLYVVGTACLAWLLWQGAVEVGRATLRDWTL